MKKNIKTLKDRLLGILLKNGNKPTNEKLVNQALKVIQKKTKKNYKPLLKASILNLIPIFKINQQKLKKGKRKTIKTIPTFVAKNSLRAASALKLLSQTSNNLKRTYQKNTSVNLAEEILISLSQQNKSTAKQREVHKEAFINKRYLTKFRW